MVGVLITRKGFQKLQDELTNLKGDVRHKIIAEVAEARSHGDLSENAEYDAAKEKQRMVDAKITALTELLSKATVVDVSSLKGDIIEFGATVKIEDDETGKVTEYQIVGDCEADIDAGLISIESPLAKGLLGKQCDDSVDIHIGGKERTYNILEVQFKE